MDKIIRPCGHPQCDKNLGGDILRPMCYICAENPYLPEIEIVARHIFTHAARGRNVDWSCARSGSKWDCKVRAWKALCEIGYKKYD